MSVCVCARFVYAFESIEKPENPITQNAVRGLKRLQSATGSFFGFVAFTSFSPVSTCLLISAEVSGAHIAAEDEEESQGAWRRGSSKRRRRSIKTGKSNEKKNDEIEKSKKKKNKKKRRKNFEWFSGNSRIESSLIFTERKMQVISSIRFKRTYTHTRTRRYMYICTQKEREREREGKREKKFKSEGRKGCLSW